MDTKDMVRLFSLTRLSVTLLLSLVTTVSFSGVTSAQASIRFNSPSLGAPGNREAGASRSAPCAASDRGLVALLPETNLGLTTQAYPTFFASDSNLLSQVEAAQPQEIPVIYAAAGTWHEALSTLVDLNRANPNDPTVNANLDELLGSVGLEAIANEPLF